MRATIRGRWVVRVACAIGVGVAVLSGPTAVNASSVPAVGVAPRSASSSIAHSLGSASSHPVFTADDLVWD
jgi:hypothetical protein